MNQKLIETMQRPLLLIDSEGGIISVSEKVGKQLGSFVGYFIYYFLIPLMTAFIYTIYVTMQQIKQLRKSHLLSIAKVFNLKINSLDTKTTIEHKLVEHLDQKENASKYDDLMNLNQIIEREQSEFTEGDNLAAVNAEQQDEAIIEQQYLANINSIDIYNSSYGGDFFGSDRELKDVYSRYLTNWLELNSVFSLDELKVAYRKAAGKHHPDKWGDSELFTYITEFYKAILHTCFEGEKAKRVSSLGLVPTYIVLSEINPIQIEINKVQNLLTKIASEKFNQSKNRIEEEDKKREAEFEKNQQEILESLNATKLARAKNREILEQLNKLKTK